MQFNIPRHRNRATAAKQHWQLQLNVNGRILKIKFSSIHRGCSSDMENCSNIYTTFNLDDWQWIEIQLKVISLIELQILLNREFDFDSSQLAQGQNCELSSHIEFHYASRVIISWCQIKSIYLIVTSSLPKERKESHTYTEQAQIWLWAFTPFSGNIKEARMFCSNVSMFHNVSMENFIVSRSRIFSIKSVFHGAFARKHLEILAFRLFY